MSRVWVKPVSVPDIPGNHGAMAYSMAGERVLVTGAKNADLDAYIAGAAAMSRSR